MGNVTVAIVKRGTVKGQGRFGVIADFTFSSSYATNGDTIVAGDIAKLFPEGYALGDVVRADFEGSSAGKSAFLDKAAKKLKGFTGGTEFTNASDQSAVTIRAELEYGSGIGV